MSQKSDNYQHSFHTDEPVPIPSKLKWREFRIRFIPMIMFAAAVLIVFSLWDNRVQSPDFIGHVVADERVITSPVQGLLSGYNFEDFDQIDSGTILGSVVTPNPEYLQARLDRVKAEMDVIRTDLQSIADLQRNTLNYTGLLLDKMQIRTEIASLGIELDRKEREFQRAEQLFNRELLEEEAFDQIRSERDLLKTRVEEKTSTISQMETRLSRLQLSSTFDDNRAETAIQAALRAQEAELKMIESEMRPIPIRSPISGVINLTRKKDGAFISPGDTIAVVQADRPDYIVGYLRQPFSVKPEVGMKVEIRSRKPARDRYESEIVSLGGQIMPIFGHMQRPGAHFESGLPVKVALWEDNEFYPGEIVDLILRP